MVDLGSILKAECECGYSAKVTFGEGMINFDKKFFLPTLCRNCKEIVNINFRNKRNRCPKCRRNVEFFGKMI